MPTATPAGAEARNLTLVPPPAQPIIPGTEAVKANRPFVVRCRKTKTGNAARKAIYLTAATYCDTYTDGDFGRCWPGLALLRLESEVPRARFFREWKALQAAGLIEVNRRPNHASMITVRTLHPAPAEVRKFTRRSLPEVHPSITSGSSPVDHSEEPREEPVQDLEADVREASLGQPVPVPREGLAPERADEGEGITDRQVRQIGALAGDLDIRHCDEFRSDDAIVAHFPTRKAATQCITDLLRQRAEIDTGPDYERTAAVTPPVDHDGEEWFS